MSYGFNMVGPNASKDPSSGNTIKVVGGGSFDTTAGTVVATGSFAEFDASGSVIAQGTWQATAFVSFVSYGGPSPGFQGGQLMLTVTAETPTRRARVSPCCGWGGAADPRGYQRPGIIRAGNC